MVATTRQVVAAGVAVNKVRAGGFRAIHYQREALVDLLKRACRIGPIVRAVIECPMFYGESNKARIEDLLNLSLVAGMAAGALEGRVKTITMVHPFEWKGQRPKHVDQTATLEYYCWDYRKKSQNAAMPKAQLPETLTFLSDIPQASMVDVVDAMGLAWYAMKMEMIDGGFDT